MSTQEEVFTITFWQEKLSNEEAEWRGKIRHIRTDQARYFRDWSNIVGFVTRILMGHPQSQELPQHINESSSIEPEHREIVKQRSGREGVASQERVPRKKLSHNGLGFMLAAVGAITFLIGWNLLVNPGSSQKLLIPFQNVASLALLWLSSKTPQWDRLSALLRGK
jgi:hypothetical protein